MPRQSQRAAISARTEARLTEQEQRRREAAQRGAQTRRTRQAQSEAEAVSQPGRESGTQGNVGRNARDRVHADLLTVAIRGPFAQKMRALSERSGMSLAKLLKDALLIYEQKIAEGYQPGSVLLQGQEAQRSIENE
jgi:hypothetical protein